MKELTKDQYDLLTTKYGYALTLAKQSMLANGIDDLIPMYEDLAGVTMNPNCTDCRMDMMIVLYTAVAKYEAIGHVKSSVDNASKKAKGK